MRALVLAEVGRFELVDLPDPEPGPGEARIRVEQSGICGSELGGFRGTDGLRHPGLVFGHEVVGTVDRYGPDTPAPDPRLAVGARVTVNPLRSCGHCRICRAGRPNVCPRRQLLGGHVHGGNAEYVVVPVANLHALAADRAHVAVLAEPTACALRAVRRTQLGRPDPGGRPRSALVLGAGPIGLLLLEVLREHGVSTLLFTERMPGRVGAAEAGGATRVTAEGEAFQREVHQASDGYGVDAVFDAVGSEQTRADAIRAVRSGGDVCFVGLHSADSTLPVRELIRREVCCTTSFAYSPGDFAEALDLLQSDRIRFHAEVVHVGLAAGQSWYEQLIDGHAAGKVVLEPGLA